MNRLRETFWRNFAPGGLRPGIGGKCLAASWQRGAVRYPTIGALWGLQSSGRSLRRVDCTRSDQAVHRDQRNGRTVELAVVRLLPGRLAAFSVDGFPLDGTDSLLVLEQVTYEDF